MERYSRPLAHLRYGVMSRMFLSLLSALLLGYVASSNLVGPQTVEAAHLQFSMRAGWNSTQLGLEAG